MPANLDYMYLVMALIFWYGGQLLSRHELSVDSYFIIYTAIMFGGQAAGFSFGFSTSMRKPSPNIRVQRSMSPSH